MSDYKFEIGQRVRSSGNTVGTVTYRYHDRSGIEIFVVRWDGECWEIDRYAGQLSPAPLRRGDVVQREQADSIPAGTIVRSAGRQVEYKRKRDGDWFAFGRSTSFEDDYFYWPVTVEIPAGDDGD